MPRPLLPFDWLAEPVLCGPGSCDSKAPRLLRLPREGDPGSLPACAGRMRSSTCRSDTGTRRGRHGGLVLPWGGGGGSPESRRPGTKAPRQPLWLHLPPAAMASLSLGGLNVSARRKSVQSRNAAVERRNLITVCR